MPHATMAGSRPNSRDNYSTSRDSSPNSRVGEPNEELPTYTRDPFQDFPNDFKVNQAMQADFGEVTSEQWAITSPEDDAAGYAPESVLSRGLQVPSRTRYLSSGFAFPVILEQAGVTKQMWTSFAQEISSHASLSPKQWLTAIGGGAGMGFVGVWAFGPIGLVPAAMIGHKVRSKKERQNIAAAKYNGAMVACLKRWNDTYFSQKGLAIRIDLPGEIQDMQDMDVSTSKLYKQSPGGLPEAGGPFMSKTDSKLLHKDMKARRKAIMKGRIVITPLKPMPAGEELQESRPLTGDEADDDGDADTVSVAASDEVTLNEESYRRRDMYPNEPKP